MSDIHADHDDFAPEQLALLDEIRAACNSFTKRARDLKMAFLIVVVAPAPDQCETLRGAMACLSNTDGVGQAELLAAASYRIAHNTLHEQRELQAFEKELQGVVDGVMLATRKSEGSA